MIEFTPPSKAKATATREAAESARAFTAKGPVTDRVGEPVNVPVDDANDPVFPEAIEVR